LWNFQKPAKHSWPQKKVGGRLSLMHVGHCMVAFLVQSGVAQALESDCGGSLASSSFLDSTINYFIY
jgi:hypothetical protein